MTATVSQQSFFTSSMAAPALRLGALHPLDGAAIHALHIATERPRPVIRPHREVMTEGREIGQALLVLDGWGAQVHQLAGGQRQILSFILPGDLIGFSDLDRPIAPATIVAITPMLTCVAPDRSVSPALARAYAVGRAIDEAYLMAQITRLGRLNAHDRITDLLGELLERLTLVGLAENGRFSLPLTQELVADALGLTSVHVNRVLQQARRDGDLIWSGRDVALIEPAALRSGVGRRPVQVMPPAN